jgi:eukaryotic-like serine/threonine-protein kinase
MPVQYATEWVEKRLSERERGETEAATRLRSEAELLRLLSSTSSSRPTPRLLGRGEDERGPWHRVERIAIPTVETRLLRAEGGPLPSTWIERAARSAFATLGRIHEAADENGPLGIVHADVSPANLAIDDDGDRAVVLDFDLAWWRGGPPRDGAFRGTIGYVAPEIARGEPPTAPSDLFSLAAVLLHAATGRPPRVARRTGDGTAALASLLVDAAEVPLLRPEVLALAARGPGHAAIVACLAHEPADRPASASAIGLPPVW